MDGGSSDLSPVRTMWQQREEVEDTHPRGFMATWGYFGLSCKIFKCRAGLVVKVIESIRVLPSRWSSWSSRAEQWQLLFQTNVDTVFLSVESGHDEKLKFNFRLFKEHEDI